MRRVSIAAGVLLLFNLPCQSMPGGHVTGGVCYIPNMGQWPAPFRYLAPLGNTTMFLQDNAVTWVSYASEFLEQGHHGPNERSDAPVHGHAWRVRFVGADTAARLVPDHRTDAALNYFRGTDTTRWVRDVHGFSDITYKQLWPGVDLRWTSAGQHVKYDLLLRPGADVRNVAFEYQGIEGMAIDQEGDLVITTSLGQLTELKPIAWYADDHQPLECAFRLTDRIIGFSFTEDLDPARPIVIDPVLAGATYSGTNSNWTYGYCGTYDNGGNIYGAGSSFLGGFPTTLGAFQVEHSDGYWDIVINKFTPDASDLIWSTYLGGAFDQRPLSMVTNDAGEVHVLGVCYGTGYPTTAGSLFPDTIDGRDMVVSHLDPSGSALLGSTYLGGSLNDGLGPNDGTLAHWGSLYKAKIELDSMGNIWLISTTQSPDYPVSPGALQDSLAGEFDVVITCLSSDCSSLLRSTYLGGERADLGADLAFASNGDIYACGTTGSQDFPLTQGSFQDTCQCVDGFSYDGFIVRLSHDLSSELYGTDYGTEESDWMYLMDLDRNGNVLVTGLTQQGVFPIDPPGLFGQEGNAFIAEFDSTLAERILSTTLGHGVPWEFPFIPCAFGVDSCDRINISGYQAHEGLLCTSDALEDNFVDDDMIYLAAFAPGMTDLLFGSFYGGSHIDGGHSRFNDAGVLFQGICSHNGEMPATSGAFSEGEAVDYDLGLLKVDLYAELCDLNVSTMEAIDVGDGISILPIPASNSIMVSGMPPGAVPQRFDVIDITGKSVLRGVLAPDRSLGISTLASGTYVLRLESLNGEMRSVRFIKE